MAEKSNIPEKLNKIIATAFPSIEVLEHNLRPQFKEGLFVSTRARLEFLLALLFVAQISNLITNGITRHHGDFTQIFAIGSTIMICVCAFFILFFEYTKRAEKKNKKKLSYWTRSMSTKICVSMLLVTTLIFIYGDLHENLSLTNYMLMVIALGMVPNFTWRELLCYLLPITSFSVIIGVDAGASGHILVQIVMLPILSLYSAQLRYHNSLRDFREKQALNAANAELEKLSETDPLTKLLNRRGMEKHIRSLTNSHRRSGENICMLMLDIDYFKQYNDKYLHTEGDRCLAKVGECLKNSAKRSTDIVARYGGEEFVVVVQDMKPSELVAFSLMIKNAVEALKISFDEARPYVTISVGVVLMEMQGSNPSDELFIAQLIERSDTELYNAKNNGRNCVSIGGVIHR